MERHPNDLTTDEEIDEAFERAKEFESFPTIVEAEFVADPKHNYLSLRLSDGQRMLIPKEMLGELKHATVEQATDLMIKLQGLAVWWPQIDDGLYLPDFLEHRWGKTWVGSVAA
jgi:hypothetical protein